LGAFGAALVGITLINLPGLIGIPLALLVSAIAGGLYALLPAILRVKYNIDEVIVTIMLNTVAVLLTGYLVNYPFAADVGKLGATEIIGEGYHLSRLVRLSTLN